MYEFTETQELSRSYCSITKSVIGFGRGVVAGEQNFDLSKEDLVTLSSNFWMSMTTRLTQYIDITYE